MAKDKFIIEPHFRLQEWVAEEKGYFREEGLDYVFQVSAFLPLIGLLTGFLPHLETENAKRITQHPEKEA